jgi:hypothetical protein
MEDRKVANNYFFVNPLQKELENFDFWKENNPIALEKPNMWR